MQALSTLKPQFNPKITQIYKDLQGVIVLVPLTHQVVAYLC